MPAFVLAKVLTPPFFARQDTRRPMIYAVSSVVITIVVGTALFFGLSRMGQDGVLGLAIATSLSAWINVALLAGTLMREDAWRPTAPFVSRMARILAASAVMGGLLLAAGAAYPMLARLLLAKEIAVVLVCGAGMVVYALAVVLFRATSVSELKAVLRREPGAAPVSMD